MEGPTPVSALIHAATMVAAGVYMLCRVFFIYSATPCWPPCGSFLPQVSALTIIAWIGGVTALMAALIAVQQSDIKRILAYSTLSQLGLMVMAVGLGGATPAMYHLTTHAFFKALLFLGAGSVIHAMHHEQDIWKMGGLAGRLPITFWTFLAGTLALTGVPGLSGFFSKDLILAAALENGKPLFVVGLIVSVLTSFYMFRLLWVAFLGQARTQAPHHAHESPLVMTLPLLALAVPSVLAGYWHIEPFLAAQLGEVHYPGEKIAMGASIGAMAVGFVLATVLYRGAVQDPLPAKLGAVSRAMRERFYFDEFYAWVIARTHDALATFADAVDRWVIAGLMVRGVHGTTELVGRALRLVQTGNVQTYAFLFAVGVAFVLYYALR
jgi:NADH-quinone oxidoreductase subunit L